MKRRRRPDPYGIAINALDSSRRVGWAKFYEAREENAALQHLCLVLTDRVETLLPEFVGLVRAVLFDCNQEAFGRAYRIQTLIDKFLEGGRR